MIRLGIEAVGIDAVRNFYRDGIKAFQRGQIREMRRAGQLVVKRVRLKLKSGDPLKSSGEPHVPARGRKPIGPLAKHIRLRVRPTLADVAAFIAPSRRGFYGRFHETGLRQAGTVKAKRVVFIGGKFVTLTPGKTRPFSLKRRQFLAPVAESTRDEVVEILGDAYNVFL